MHRMIFVLPLCALGLAGCGDTGPASESRGAIAIQLATGSFHTEGITPDGYAIVSDLKNHVVNAVNVATGASQKILSTSLAPGAPFLWGSSIVLLWSDLSMDGGSAHLTAWSAAGGAHLLSSNATSDFYNGARISADGQRIAYWAHVDAATDALTIDNPAHTAARTLVSVSSGCRGFIRMTQDGQRVGASYCTIPAMGVPQDRLVTVFNLGAGTSVTLQTNAAFGFRFDPTGHRALVRARTGAATIVSLDGTEREALDNNVGAFQFFNNGVELIYESGGALKRICTSGQPEVMMPSNVGGTFWMTPDNSAIAYYTSQDTNSGNGDIRLASTVVAGPPLVLNADGSGHPEAFSGDSKWALFYNAVDAKGHVGTFTVMPTAGGLGRVLSNGQAVVDSDWELSGGKVVFNDQYTPATGTTPERVSIEAIDLNAAAAPTQLVTGADPIFAVTADEKTLVYTTSDPMTGGLYTIKLP